jgi:hypothetical protein
MIPEENKMTGPKTMILNFNTKPKQRKGFEANQKKA